MLIIPAIDLKGGRCVRLFRGDMEQETVYAEDPLEAALAFREQGARFLHLVDLDGAVAGRPVNLEAVRRIVAEAGIPVELGGGLRDFKTVEETLALGVARVILGTAAVKNPGLVAECCSRFGERVVVGIDSKNGKVAVEGWLKTSERTALEVALEVKALGAKRIIYTDTWRDGALSGPNLAATGELARQSGLSRSSFAERFTEFVGTPPMQYLQRWRLQMAASKLLDGATSIAVVAAQTGYESEAAFSRAFKRVLGEPPAEWRDKRRASA